MGILQAILVSMPGAVAQGLIWGIMAIGVYITFKVLDFADLTVDGSICTGMAVCAMLIAAGWNVWLAMLAALLAGMLTGLVTGLFHTLLGIPAILSGILTQLILWSMNLVIMGKANQPVNAMRVPLLVTRLHLTESILILIAFNLVLIGVLYWFFGTEFGSALRATGCNKNMARAQGINTNLHTVFALMLSNGSVALSGALLAQYQGSADINNGRGAIVIGLAAVIIGEAIVSKISRNFIVRLLGVALGAVIYYIVYQIVIGLRIPTDLLKMLSAIVVAIFLAVPYWKKKFAKPLRKEAPQNAET
ncbi:MAG: ABC transporter permease [Clostridia bacterium]|nr:ABC transporter permease [Clostridia bacterium]